MKKQTTLMTIAMALCMTVFFSCNKTETEGDPDVPNEMQVNNQSYELGGGLLVDWQEVNNGAADFDIALYTEGIVINGEGQPENEGSMIYFDLNSFSSSDFEGGKFNFGEERGPGVITGSSLVLDYNGDPNVMPVAAYINSGELRVTETNGVYEILFELITIDGDQVNGSYIGLLERRANN